MPPRRTHTKSRSGCAKCKQRRIKCDEVHPSCGNCVKHAIVCDFSTIPSASSPPPAAATAAAAAPPPPLSRDRNAGGMSTPRAINMVDMRLLHHWTLSVPNSLCAGEDVLVVWRDIVPRLAFYEGKSDCLVHAILAISALHMSATAVVAGADFGGEERDEKGMMAIAADHYGEAVRGVKESVSVPEGINRENCEGLFTSAVLIVVYAIARPLIVAGDPGGGVGISPGVGKAGGPSEWTVPDWLPLIRGVHSILEEVWPWIKGGCLSPLLGGHDNPSAQEPSTSDEALQRLFRICTDRREPSPDEIQDSATSAIYFSAIHELQKSFANGPALRTRLVSLVFIWPIMVSESFFALLQERRPRALIIFAHYCVLLKVLGEGFWWVDGRAAYELERIEVNLGEEWKKWLEWPVKMIRG